MTDVNAVKKAARAAAYPLRARLHGSGAGHARQAASHALGAIAARRDVGIVSAYLPIRDEIDPLPAMLLLHGLGYRLCVPVIEGRGLPLKFREWTPGVALATGPFGVAIPAEGEWLTPDALLVPMLAFDAEGFRLGYGGGFYDRTLIALRARAEVAAIGFAYAGQQVAYVPRHDGDAHLDAVVTERGLAVSGFPATEARSRRGVALL